MSRESLVGTNADADKTLRCLHVAGTKCVGRDMQHVISHASVLVHNSTTGTPYKAGSITLGVPTQHLSEASKLISGVLHWELYKYYSLLAIAFLRTSILYPYSIHSNCNTCSTRASMKNMRIKRQGWAASTEYTIPKYSSKF